MKNILIIHGEKLKRDGGIHEAFLARLNRAIELSKKIEFNYIIVSGGKTRKGFPSEAEVGAYHLKSKTKIEGELISEEESKSTSENIRYARKIIISKGGCKINDKIYVISDRKRACRIKLLYSKLFLEAQGHIEFIFTNSLPWWYFINESIYFWFAKIDPEEKVFAAITKKFFRNA